MAESVESIDFGGLTIAFDGGVLRPRPWTATQAQWTAEVACDAPAGPILEVCAGAGHIGLLAAVLSDRPLVQVDSDPSACRFARANAERAGVGDRVDIRCDDITRALRSDERFPLIVADPPYIPSAEVGRFQEDPRVAIDGGQDGLRLIRGCLDVVKGHLSERGACLLQVRGRPQLAELEPLSESRSLVVRATWVVDEDRAVAFLGREGDER
jgi:release factor glutamine methyltransferase